MSCAFCATARPRDPRPSLVIHDGRIVEMDGVPAASFDLIDEFIARHYCDLTIATEAMALDSREFARLLVDVDVPREHLVKLSDGPPARLAEAMGHLSLLEAAAAVYERRGLFTRRY